MKKHQWVVLAICLFLMFFNFLLPTPAGLNALGLNILCIFVCTIVLMLTIDVIWPVFVAVLALSISGVYVMKEAVALSLGNLNFWFVVFNGIIVYAMRQCGLLRRIAVWMVTRPFAKKSPWLFLGTLWAATLIFGSIFNITANIIIFTALAAEIMNELGVKKGDRFAEVVMMGILVMTGIAYGISPIGHTVAILAMSMFEELFVVSYVQYMIVSFAVAVVFFALFMLIMRYVYRLDVSRIQDFDPEVLKQNNTPMSIQEKWCAVIFVIVVALWLLPGFVQNSIPALYTFLNQMNAVFPSILGTMLLILIHVDGKPLVNLRECLVKGVPWAAAFPMGCAMLLGSALTISEAGITTWLTELLSPVFGGMSPIFFVLIMGLIVTLMTQFCSNTVACMVSCTVAIALINGGLFTNLHPGAVAIVMGCVTNFAYATPGGGTYGAYVFGDGWVRSKVQFKEGMIFAGIAGILYCTLGYLLGTIVL